MIFLLITFTKILYQNMIFVCESKDIKGPALREFRVHGRSRNLNFLYTMGPRDTRIFNFLY